MEVSSVKPGNQPPDLDGVFVGKSTFLLSTSHYLQRRNRLSQNTLQPACLSRREWAEQGLVVPHVGRTIDSTSRRSMPDWGAEDGTPATLGNVVVIVDRDLVEGS